MPARPRWPALAYLIRMTGHPQEFVALARALHIMHAQNVVHRDLKPSNIMAVGGWNLTGIKVTDFGVADWAEIAVRTWLAKSM